MKTRVLAILAVLSLLVFPACKSEPVPPAPTPTPVQTPLADTSAQPDRGREQAEREAEERAHEEARLELERRQLLAEANRLVSGYFYDEALTVLGGRPDDAVIAERAAEIEALKSGVVEYSGEVHHIFLHSLIIYPQLAFGDTGAPKEGYNSTMSTRDEFLKLLPQLYERGYVLYDINDLFGRDENGARVRNPVYLPKGKMPLILSQDDVCYYNYMRSDGFATRLVINENGEVSTEVKDLQGNVSVTRDGDLIPIVDDFIKAHPDFSYRGAKGIIALTGFEGIFGYRLETEEQKLDAKAVADALKADGWRIANHSFTHNRKGYWGAESSVSKIQYDVRRWTEDIQPLVGSTNLFIAPFGYVLPKSGMQVIIDAGYDIYCSVVSRPKIDTSNPNIAIQGRYEIAGYNMKNDAKYVNEHFFDVEQVIDKTRPSGMA